jgi:hypothetical protein
MRVTGAEAYDIIYVGESKYTLQKENGNCLNIAPGGTLSFALEAVPYTFIVPFMIIEIRSVIDCEGERV